MNSSEMLENQENVKSISDKGYHAVPSPYTGNYIPPKHDLMFIDKEVESESMDVVSNVSSSDVKTVESKHESVDVKNKGVYSTKEIKPVRKNIFVLQSLRIGILMMKGNLQQKEYKEKRVIDSDGKGIISGKGKIKTKTLDFDDVYLCKELKYNLFSVSQMCEKKNIVLFTDTECLVLSSNFKLLNESQVLLRVPRKDNIYSVDLKSVVPTGGQAKKKKELKQEYILIPICTTDPLNSQVDLPKDKWAIGTKWVFRNKKDKRGIVVRNKARLVAQGHTQEEGKDYDEVFALVARIKAIRLFLAYASFKDFVVYQMNVKSAFLYGNIEEEVYVCQLPGFEDPNFPDKVYKVEKALYRLHQALRACQEKYVTDILKKFDFTIVKTASTPIEPNKALVKDAEAEDVDVHSYRSMIGSLMYLTASRPHITFAVYACVRFQVTPKTSHLHAMKRIFRYLKGGYQFLGKRLISWQCKKQTIVANSTTKAGYVAAASCC
nr:putative ribonuclease H-like domain-containing protein [Tanacetum cinerariifolium]